MPGRRAALAVVLAGAAAFGGGAAFAATHGGSAHPLQPPKVKQVKHPAVTNVHLPCHNRGAAPTSV